MSAAATYVKIVSSGGILAHYSCCNRIIS